MPILPPRREGVLDRTCGHQMVIFAQTGHSLRCPGCGAVWLKANASTDEHLAGPCTTRRSLYDWSLIRMSEDHPSWQQASPARQFKRSLA